MIDYFQQCEELSEKIDLKLIAFSHRQDVAVLLEKVKAGIALTRKQFIVLQYYYDEQKEV